MNYATATAVYRIPHKMMRPVAARVLMRDPADRLPPTDSHHIGDNARAEMIMAKLSTAGARADAKLFTYRCPPRSRTPHASKGSRTWNTWRDVSTRGGGSTIQLRCSSRRNRSSEELDASRSNLANRNAPPFIGRSRLSSRERSSSSRARNCENRKSQRSHDAHIVGPRTLSLSKSLAIDTARWTA